jgi:hypothetical protein
MGCANSIPKVEEPTKPATVVPAQPVDPEENMSCPGKILVEVTGLRMFYKMSTGAQWAVLVGSIPFGIVYVVAGLGLATAATAVAIVLSVPCLLIIGADGTMSRCGPP